MKRGNRPASRGFVNNIILECLMQGDKYGYEIIKEVEDRSGGKIQLKQPSLYSSLKRFEQKGYISSYWGDSEIGGRRHYYSITGPGRDYINSRASKEDLDDEEEDSSPAQEEQFDQMSFEDLGDYSTDSYEVDESNGEDDLSDDYINSITSSSDDFDVHNLDIQDEVIPAETNDETKDMSEVMSESLEYVNKNIVKDEDDAYLQPDLFDVHDSNNITNEEYSIDHDNISKSKVEEVETIEDSDDGTIPLVEENSNIFFNWDERKRQVIEQNRTDETESSEVITKNNPALKIDDEKIDLDLVDETDEKESPKNDARFIEGEPNIHAKNINYTLEPNDKTTTTTTTTNNRSIDYKNILGELYTVEDEKEEVPPTPQPQTTVNEPVYADYTPKVSDRYDADSSLEQLVEDGFKFKPYTSSTEPKNTTFIRSNKLILVVSIIVGIFQMLHNLTTYLILDAKHVYNTQHMPLFIISGIIGVLIIAYGVARYIAGKDQRKPIKTGQVTTWITLSFVTFLIITILVFGLNMMSGMQFSNIDIFYGSIFVPILTALDIPVSVVVYYTLQDKKMFYK